MTIDKPLTLDKPLPTNEILTPTKKKGATISDDPKSFFAALSVKEYQSEFALTTRLDIFNRERLLANEGVVFEWIPLSRLMVFQEGWVPYPPKYLAKTKREAEQKGTIFIPASHEIMNNTYIVIRDGSSEYLTLCVTSKKGIANGREAKLAAFNKKVEYAYEGDGDGKVIYGNNSFQAGPTLPRELTYDTSPTGRMMETENREDKLEESPLGETLMQLLEQDSTSRK